MRTKFHDVHIHCTSKSFPYGTHKQQSTYGTVQCTECTVYSVQCTVYSVQCTVYSVHCKVYSMYIWTILYSEYVVFRDTVN